MFHGATVLTLDAKGRLAIPTRHRDALVATGRTLVLSAHPDGCALIYPEAEWERAKRTEPRRSRNLSHDEHEDHEV